MGNAHAWRHRSGRGEVCNAGCAFCKARPGEGKFKNSNGHRHNPTRKKGGKKHPERSFHGAPGHSLVGTAEVNKWRRDGIH